MGTVPGPPVTLASVRSVFGGAAGTPLHAYVRGGAYVPDIPANNGVPTTPPITLHQLAGATTQSVTASASPASVSGSRNTIGTATTGITTATLSGATPTGYSWTKVSGDAMSCNGLTSAQASFSGSVSGANPFLSSVWECTISYAGGSAVTNQVTASVSYTA